MRAGRAFLGSWLAIENKTINGHSGGGFVRYSSILPKSANSGSSTTDGGHTERAIRAAILENDHLTLDELAFAVPDYCFALEELAHGDAVEPAKSSDKADAVAIIIEAKLVYAIFRLEELGIDNTPLAALITELFLFVLCGVVHQVTIETDAVTNKF